MFDLGWTELLLIGVVALIVVGPKDLPGMFRTVGQFVGKAKGMAREFTKAMNDAADEAGVSQASDTLRKATNPIGSAMDEVRKSAKSFTQSTRDAGKRRSDSAKLAPEGQGMKDKIAAKSAKITQGRLDRDAEPSAPAQPDADTASGPSSDAATQPEPSRNAAANDRPAEPQQSGSAAPSPAAPEAKNPTGGTA